MKAKKFLSVVLSIMTMMLMFTAFSGFTVSAEESDENVAWVLPTAVAYPGDKVKVEIAVKNPLNLDIPVKSTESKFSTGGLEITDFDFSALLLGDSQTAVKDSDVTYITTTALPNAFADDNKVFKFEVQIPYNAADGTVYPLTWDYIKAADNDGNDISSKIVPVDGRIIVKDDRVLPQIENGHIGWIIPEVKAKAGETADLDILVYDNNAEGSLGVSLAEFTINNVAPIMLESAQGSDAYDTKMQKVMAIRHFGIFQNNSKCVTAPNGATVLSLSYRIPEDTPGGKYRVYWDRDNFTIRGADGKDISGMVTLVDGAIIVEEAEPSTVPTEPKEIVYGDANSDGNVTISDAVTIMSYSSNADAYPLDADALECADVYSRGDGVNNMDALAVQKFVAQILDKLPES